MERCLRVSGQPGRFGPGCTDRPEPLRLICLLSQLERLVQNCFHIPTLAHSEEPKTGQRHDAGGREQERHGQKLHQCRFGGIVRARFDERCRTQGPERPIQRGDVMLVGVSNAFERQRFRALQVEVLQQEEDAIGVRPADVVVQSQAHGLARSFFEQLEPRSIHLHQGSADIRHGVHHHMRSIEMASHLDRALSQLDGICRRLGQHPELGEVAVGHRQLDGVCPGVERTQRGQRVCFRFFATGCNPVIAASPAKVVAVKASVSASGSDLDGPRNVLDRSIILTGDVQLE